MSVKTVHTESSQSTDQLGKKDAKAERLKLFEIDFIGGDTYRVSQNYILQKRSLDNVAHKDSLAVLSARGLYHRDRDYFSKELTETNQLIKSSSKLAMSHKGGSHQMYLHYFQRALTLERLGQTAKAIEAYTVAIKNGRSEAQAYYNRSGLYQAQGKFDEAKKDLDKAVSLDPANIDYRYNRALLHRRTGNYLDAIQDTMMRRALELQPHIAADVKAGKPVSLDPEVLGKFKKTVDPLIKALRITDAATRQKNILPIIEFLKNLKYFQNFKNEYEILSIIASKVQLMTFPKGSYVFHEGDPGLHFFIVVDGEISIVKAIPGSATKVNVLVKLFRGHTFGETALESRGGLRSAGAFASQPSNLMAMHVDDYQAVLSNFSMTLRTEVRDVLKGCPVFKTWSDPMIEHLASVGVTRFFAPNSTIIKEGERTKFLYIVKTGIVQIVKNIERPNCSLTGLPRFKQPDSEMEMEAPGIWVVETNWKNRLGVFGDKEVKDDPQRFVTAIIGSGQVLGELAILDSEAHSPTSAISFTNVELYCFESQQLLTLGARYNGNTMNELNESLNLSNPPAEKLAFLFRSKVNWEKKQSKIIRKLENDGILRKPDDD